MKRIYTFPAILLLALLSCSWSLPAAATPTVSPGGVLFQDDFSSNHSGWSRMQAAEGTMDYDAGGYRILVNALETNFWATPQKMFSDVRVEVDLGKLAGPDENRAGVVCRSNGSEYYFFILSSDGYYGLGRFSGGSAELIGQDAMKFSEAIHTGLAVNHLRADCVGSTLTFYVNSIQVAQAQDALLPSGDVGILAGTFETPGVDMVFDNFVALQP